MTIWRAAFLSLIVAGGATVHGIAASQAAADSRTRVERTATGTFDVDLTPEADADGGIATLRIAKTFHGDLDGTSTGRMLAVMTDIDGSAGYVAMERVTATLASRKGGFALQHSGTMDRGAQSLSIAVVPDSGTGALAGIAGTMTIRVEGGTHFYSLRYTLPD
ncbi:MAG: DUF3224 domain-containing protein [Pseudomonadota bacterium]